MSLLTPALYCHQPPLLALIQAPRIDKGSVPFHPTYQFNVSCLKSDVEIWTEAGVAWDQTLMSKPSKHTS